MHHNGFSPPRNPVLEPIESIRCMDAIVDTSDPENPKEPDWPEADFIVGNPPFVGGNKIRTELGDPYVDPLFRLYRDRISGFADLCCYSFEKGRRQLELNRSRRVGLLATQGIRGGVNREVLDHIKATGDIFFAESDRDWILDGATVHVSMAGFDLGDEKARLLDGQAVPCINSNLTALTDVTRANALPTNKNLCVYGSQQKPQFDIAPDVAWPMLNSPNAARVANSDVVRPSQMARDL